MTDQNNRFAVFYLGDETGCAFPKFYEGNRFHAVLQSVSQCTLSYME